MLDVNIVGHSCLATIFIHILKYCKQVDVTKLLTLHQQQSKQLIGYNGLGQGNGVNTCIRLVSLVTIKQTHSFCFLYSVNTCIRLVSRWVHHNACVKLGNAVLTVNAILCDITQKLWISLVDTFSAGYIGAKETSLLDWFIENSIEWRQRPKKKSLSLSVNKP